MKTLRALTLTLVAAGMLGALVVSTPAAAASNPPHPIYPPGPPGRPPVVALPLPPGVPIRPIISPKEVE